MPDRRRWVAVVLAAVLVPVLGPASEPASAASLVVDGLDGDWSGQPTGIAGTAGYDTGTWSYTDYPYDDEGTGSFAYPEEGPYGANAADPVVLQIGLGADAVHYLVRLDTLLAPDTTVVGLAVDTDDDEQTGGGAWPLNAKLTTPGWEYVINAWGAGGSVTTSDGTTTPIDVSANIDLNLIEFAVPYSVADPAGATWRYRGGAGLWDGEQWTEVVPASDTAPATSPTGKSDPNQPNLFNLLFRNRTWDGGTEATDENSSGGFQVEQQSDALSSGDVRDFFRDVDFSVLASGATSATPEPTGDHNFTRVYASAAWPNALPEGISSSGVGNFLYNGRFQPYILFVPASYWTGLPDSAPMVPLLHGWRGNHRGFNPSGNNFWKNVVRANRVLVPKALGRGQEIWYEHVGELDVLEIMADVARHYSIDTDRIYLAGTSMGGLGTIKIASSHPDLFAGIFPSVPPMSDRAQGYAVPANNDWDLVEVAGSLRNVPVRNFTGTIDALVPAGIDSQRFCDELRELVYDHDCWRDLAGQHASYENTRAAEVAQLFAEHPRRVTDPARVSYVSDPVFRRQASDAGIAQLLSYDTVYWVTGLRWPAPPADDNPIPTWPTDPGTARRLSSGYGSSSIDVRTYGRGEGDPAAAEIADDPSPTLVRSGIVLRAGEAVQPRNHFDLTWRDVLGADLDLERMGLTLNPGHAITATLVDTSSDGNVLDLGLLGAPPPSVPCAATLDGAPLDVERDGRRLVVALDLSDGPHELAVTCVKD